MDDANKELEGVERHGDNNRDKESHNRDQNLARENVAEETEGKGDDFGEIRDELEESDKGVDWIAKVEEFFEVLETFEFETIELHHDHGDEAKSQSSIDVGGRTTQDRDEDFFAVHEALEANATGTRQEP